MDMVFIMWSLLIVYGTDGLSNVGLKKPVFTLTDVKNPQRITDGDKSKEISFSRYGNSYFVIDLQSVYKISEIIISTNAGKATLPITVAVGRDFSPCFFPKQLRKYSLCSNSLLLTKSSNIVNCNGHIGQYVGIVKGEFGVRDWIEEMTITEVEVFGELIPNETPYRIPIISKEEIPSIPKEEFEVTRQIIGGIQSVTIPEYSSGVIFVNENCKPVIWDQSTTEIFSLVCQTKDGKGRIAVFGKENFIYDIEQKKILSPLKSSLFKWLSPNNPTPSLVDGKRISSVDDIKKLMKPGDILDYPTYQPFSEDVIKKVTSMLLSGEIAVTFDHTPWSDEAQLGRQSYFGLLKLFNVDFSSTIINFGPEKQLKISLNNLDINYLSLDKQLQYLAKSNDLLFKSGMSISSKLNEVPISFLENSNAKDQIERILKKYDSYMRWSHPCDDFPAKTPYDHTFLSVLSRLGKNQLLVDSNYKLPGVELFPGDFDSPQQTKTATVSVAGQFENMFSPIGYYLEAGATLTYEVTSSIGEWSIQVGCHTDELDKNRDEWTRYEKISLGLIKLEKIGKIFSPFGGSLWLHNKHNQTSITITIKNVVQTPFFNIRDGNSVANWEKQKNSPGLWAQIAGQNLIICAESAVVKQYSGDYLKNLMSTIWDPMVRMDYVFKGKDWKGTKPEMFVFDILPSVGAGHSGYPIVGMLDWYRYVFDVELIKKEGSWGMCHEIGHNMQEDRWTFEGTGEVTNNVFCLFNYKKIFRLEAFGSNEKKLNDEKEMYEKYLDNGANFEKWKDEPFLALIIYAQMANHFGFGFYHDVFRYYEENNIRPDDNVDKMSRWMKVTSIVSGMNLLPLFEFWGIPTDSVNSKDVSTLPCFFPDDFLVSLSKKRKAEWLRKYGSCQKKAKLYKDFDPYPHIGGNLPNFFRQVS